MGIIVHSSQTEKIWWASVQVINPSNCRQVPVCHAYMFTWVYPQAAQAWDVIYKTLYGSLTQFCKLLENGPN